ncbi:L-histidine N(alpha)-methyltransferase [Flavobacterium antarcticum]|uniref:L-histidine N(alpha)-methyltransferase n=1 Tax=Flavobacterium antarcticum TaxID=271155 RepID=UPI0003B3691C|nr:L-histidine N(alpha)-methyltransferase [Flavobacterium antarcticum]
MTKNTFKNDIYEGLKSTPKSLPSKYFYDEKGDILFQKIMACDDYYLTNADNEIFSQQTKELAKALASNNEPFDVLELGAGDATKSTYLLREWQNAEADFTYYPIDISSTMISYLENEMPKRIPNLKVHGLTGEYLEQVLEAHRISKRKKVILFLGSSIGNFELHEAHDFLRKLYDEIQSDDVVLIGFDLKKNPHTILKAYNDSEGITREFNLNLLDRINQELAANFDRSKFEHFPIYNPLTGACRSFLISQVAQEVKFGDGTSIYFDAFEAIDMELSQKFAVYDIDRIATRIGFHKQSYFFDSKNYYCNAIWKK